MVAKRKRLLKKRVQQEKEKLNLQEEKDNGLRL